MISDRFWSLIIVAGFAVILWASTFYQDPDDWMVVEKVHVFDAVAGTSPNMEVNRKIVQPFRGTWLAEVNKRGQYGWTAVCSASGTNYYEPKDNLPDDIDLDWWTYPTKCPLGPGEYRVETVWTIRVPHLYPLEVMNTSNEFRVYPQ